MMNSSRRIIVRVFLLFELQNGELLVAVVVKIAGSRTVVIRSSSRPAEDHSVIRGPTTRVARAKKKNARVTRRKTGRHPGNEDP